MSPRTMPQVPSPPVHAAAPVSTVLPAAMEPWPVHWTGYLVPDLLFWTLSLPHLLSLTLNDRLWKANWHLLNQSNVFIKPFLHQLMSQSAVQKPSLKPKTASNAGVEAFTPKVLTCCTLYNPCDYYYLILLVIYERLNILTFFLATVLLHRHY